MAKGSNDLNMLLKSQVVKIRAELDVKGSLPKIKQQVDEISRKLENKPVKLQVKLDYKIGELNKQLRGLQTSLNTAKTLKPIKIKVDIDVRDSATNIKKQLQDIYKIVGDFNKKYGEQIKRMQKETQQSLSSKSTPLNAMVGGFDTKLYAQQIREAKEMMKSMFGKGNFTSTQFKDANGNLQGFIAQLEKANGVVQKIRYEWNTEAGKFMPINQQTIDGIEKHVNRASQSLRSLYADIEKLGKGKGQQNLFKQYEELEKRIGHGTLTQKAVENLKNQIKEEQALQQVISRQNKEYITQQRLIDKINGIKKSMDKQTYREQVDIDNYRQLNNILKEIQKNDNPDDLAKMALQVDRINKNYKDRVKTQRDLLANEQKRANTLREIENLERKTVFTDVLSRGNRELVEQIKLLAKRARTQEDWFRVNQKMNQLRRRNADDQGLQNIFDMSVRAEEALKHLSNTGRRSTEVIQKYYDRLNRAMSGTEADMKRVLRDIKREMQVIRNEERELAGTYRTLIDPSKANVAQRRMLDNLRGAVDAGDADSIKKYISRIYGAEVAQVKLARTTDNLGRAVDRLNVKMAGKGKTVRTYTVDLDRANKALRESATGLDYNANRNLGIMEQLRIAMARVPTWMTAMTAFYGSLRSVRAMTREILAVDKALTELRRVASSDLNIEGVFKGAVTMARELGNNVHDVMQTLNDFSRTFGEFNERQLLAITQTATLMSNVSELTAQEAGETLIATMNAFNITAEESIRIVDAFNEVDNNFAVSTKQLSEGMSKTASTAETFGVTMEESIGHITAISAVTQESGRIIGNSLKTIYSRITTMKGAEDILNSVNISIRDMEGNVRPVQDILEDLGKVWADLTDEQRQNIGVTLAGRYQLSRFLAMMNNWQMAIDATATAYTSQGSAMRENAEYLKSFEARINQLKGTFTELSLAIGDAVLSDSISLLIDLLDNLGQGVIKLVDNFGALPAVVGAIGGILSAFGVFRKLNSDVIAGFSLMGEAFKESKAQATGVTGTMRGLGGSISIMAHSAIPAFNKAMKGMVRGLKALGSATIYTAIFTAIGMGIEWVIGKFQEKKQRMKEIEEANKQLVDSYRTYSRAEENLNDLIEKHDELQKKVRSGEIKEGTEAYNDYLQVNQELADALPTMVEYVDAKGVAHLKTADAMKAELEVAEELSRQYAEDESLDFTKNIEEKVKSMDDTLKELSGIYEEIARLEESIANDGRVEVKTYRGTYSYKQDIDILKDSVRELEIQATSAKHQMQGVLNDILMDISKVSLSALEASGHLQHMTDSQIAYVESYSKKYESLLRGYMEALQDPMVLEDEDLMKGVQESLVRVSEFAKEESAKIGEAISDIMSEMLDGVTDPKEVAKIKENFDMLLNTLPQTFTDSLKGADDFKEKLSEIVDITDQMQTGAGIDEIAKQLEGYFGSYELARDYVIKLGFAYENQAIKSEALQKQQEGEIDNLQEIIALTVEAVDVTKELFGEELGGSASALQSHIEMLKAMKQLGEEGSEAWTKSLNAISEFFLVSNEEVEKNFDKYAELIDLISNFRFEFDEDGNLEKEVEKAYNRIKELSTELGIEIPINADTEELQKATEEIEKNTEKTKENTEAVEDNATAVEVLTQKFNNFKENANETTKSEWLQTIRDQIDDLDEKILITKDETLGTLKLEMADGSESEWLNTLESQIEELGGQLTILKDEKTGELKLMLNDASGSRLIASIKEDAEDANFVIDNTITNIETLSQKKALPDDFAQIDFTKLYDGLDGTIEKVGLVQEALIGVWKNVGYLDEIGIIVDDLSDRLANLKDALKSIVDADRGDFTDLEQKAKDAKTAIDDVKTAISQLNLKSSDVSLAPFSDLITHTNEAKEAVENFKTAFDGIPSKVGTVLASSVVYNVALSSMNIATANTIQMLLAYGETLIAVSKVLATTALINSGTVSTQIALAKAMEAVVKIVEGYNTAISNVGDAVAGAYEKMAGAIVEHTGRIIEQYAKHGETVVDLKEVTETGWDGVVSAIEKKGKTATDAVKKIADDMHKAFKERMEDIVDIAESLPAKIGKGISDHMASASSSMQKVAQDMVKRFKQELGIHSPSRVFEQLGGDIIAGLANGLTGADLKSLGKEVFKDFGGGIFDSWDMIKAYVANDWSGLDFNGMSGGAGVERWRGVAMQALAMTGQLTPANLERLLFQMRTESGGNPRAINLWDINAKRGTPSKGLMQVIDPTFQAYKMPGFNDIWNPLHNILASIRYTLARYGSLLRGWRGVGYEEGGFIEEEHLAMVGERNKREVIIPLEQHTNRAIQLWTQAGEELGLIDKKRRSRGGIGASFAGGFGALSGEGGSAEGGGGSGTSGIIQPSIYEGGTDVDGTFEFMALAKDPLFKVNKNERQADAYNHAISMIETRMNAMTENTLKYRNALKQVIAESKKLLSVEQKELKATKNRQKAIEKQIKSLGQTSKHTEKQRKKYNELQQEYENNISKIQRLEMSIEQTNQKIKNTTTEIFIDWIDEIVGKYDGAIEGIKAKVDDIDFKLDVLSLTDPDNIKEELKLLAQRANELQKQEATNKNLVNALQKEYDKAVKKYGKSSKEAKKVKEELDASKEALEDITLEVLRAEKNIEDARGKVADRGINQLQDYYKKMKDMSLEAIEFEKRELEKAHKAKMEMYDEEIERINKVYDERLKAMDAEKEEAEYQAELEEKNKQRAELVNKISLLSRDTSIEGRKRVNELREELATLDEEIAKFMRDRQDKMLRDAIEQQKQQQIEEIEARKEAETKEYDARVEELDNEASQITKHYDDMINDEKRWADMRNNFIKGSFSTLTQELEQMSQQLSRMTQGNFDNLTKGFAGFSDELKEEFAELFGMDVSNMNFNSEGLLDQVNDAQKSKYGVYIGNGVSYSNPSMTTWNGGSSAVIYDAKAPTAPPKSSSSKGKPLKVGGKAKVSAKNAPAYLDSYGRQVRPWADQAKYAGVGYGDSLYVVNRRGGYVALAKRNNINDAIAWVREKDVVGLRTGGYTGDWAGQDGKLAMLHKKELVLNERQTKDILNTAKIMDKVKGIIPNIKRTSVLDKLATAGQITNITYGDINVTVENGDKKKARDIAKEIMTGIKKKGR